MKSGVGMLRHAPPPRRFLTRPTRSVVVSKHLTCSDRRRGGCDRILLPRKGERRTFFLLHGHLVISGEIVGDTMHPFVKSIFCTGLIVMLSLSAIRTSRAAQVVLSDPLTSWPLNFGAQTANIMLKNGAVHVVLPGNGSISEIYTGFNFTNMDASITITPQTATGNVAGLIFWATGPGDFFEFMISDVNGNFALVQRGSANGGSWNLIVPFTQNAAIKSGAGATNTLRVVTQGNSVALYINGQTIGNADIPEPAGGGAVGFDGEGQGTQPADYVFSNLSVSQ